MKIYQLHYNSYGDELCGEFYSTARKCTIMKNKLLKYSGFKEENFSIEEIEVK